MEATNRRLLRELQLPMEEDRNLFNFIKVGAHFLFISLVALSIFLFVYDIILQHKIDEQGEEIENCQKEINFLMSEINTSLLLQSSEGQSSIIDEISSVEYTSVMLLGGDNGYSFINSTIMYNSLKKTWDVCQPSLPSRLFEHGAVVLNDTIYIFGGMETNESLSSVYELSENKKWNKLADMNEAKCCMRMSSVVFGSEIWVIGGKTGRGEPLNTVEKYNPKTNSWTPMPSLNLARHSASATVIDGKIYVSGGYSVDFMKSMEVFDPAKNEWEIIIDLPLGLSDHSSTAKGNSLMIAGGRKHLDGLSNELWKINITDPEEGWIKMPNFKKERHHHGFVELEDGLMVVGGLQNGNYLNSVEVFDGINWKNGNDLPQDRGVFGFIPLTRKQEEKFHQLFCNSTTEIRR